MQYRVLEISQKGAEFFCRVVVVLFDGEPEGELQDGLGFFGLTVLQEGFAQKDAGASIFAGVGAMLQVGNRLCGGA